MTISAFREMRPFEWLAVMMASLLCAMLGTEAEEDRSVIRVGAIFNTYLEEEVFAYAVDYVNQKGLLGPGVQMSYVMNRTNYIDTFQNVQLSCRLAEEGIVALIGPMTSTSTRAVAPVSATLKIPQISPSATDPQLESFPYLVRLTAPDSVQSRALIDLVGYFGWKRMAVLTSNTEYGVNGLLTFQTMAANRGWTLISVQQFEAKTDPSEVDARAQLQLIKNTGVYVVILNAISVFSEEIMKQAHELGMTSPGWAWVVTEGTTGAVDFFGGKDIPDYMQGIIGTVPSREHGELWQDFSDGWKELAETSGTPLKPLGPYEGKVADAVLTVAYAIANVDWNITTEPLDCEAKPVKGWRYGHAMLQAIKKVDGKGVSSHLRFDSRGAPVNPSYDIVNLKKDGWRKVGSWNPTDGLRVDKTHNITFMGGKQTVYDYRSSLANKTIVVVTQEEPPFIRFTTDDYKFEDVKPHQVEGFCIDLLNKLADTIGFNYTLYRVADGNFGLKDPITKQWNGVARDLVDRVADMAVLDFTITYVREQDMDFTTPFFDLGMGFIMAVPEKEKVRAFKFLDPFSSELWMYILMSALFVGMVVSFTNKLSPYDHHGQFIYVHDKHEKATPSGYKFFKRLKVTALDKMNFTNSTWFSVASLLQQGGETYPNSLSGRVTGVVWWLGVVIIISTYTANLAAFLTASRSHQGINSVEDLASQSKIVYGMVESSAPRQYFMDSKMTLYQDMMAFMEIRGGLVQSTMEGVERARAGGYAYIYDSAVLQYFVEQQPCNTIQTVGREFSQIGYGFGLQKNSPYKDELSTHILQLRENGFIDDLKYEWYKRRSECGGTDGGSSAAAEQIAAAGGQLDITHVLGVFYIVYGGLALSFVILLFEWVFASLSSVDRKDDLNPSSLPEALRRRKLLLKQDFIHDLLPQVPYCFPCRSNCGGSDTDVSESGSAVTTVSNVKFSVGMTQLPEKPRSFSDIVTTAIDMESGQTLQERPDKKVTFASADHTANGVGLTKNGTIDKIAASPKTLITQQPTATNFKSARWMAAYDATDFGGHQLRNGTTGLSVDNNPKKEYLDVTDNRHFWRPSLSDCDNRLGKQFTAGGHTHAAPRPNDTSSRSQFYSRMRTRSF